MYVVAPSFAGAGPLSSSQQAAAPAAAAPGAQGGAPVPAGGVASNAPSRPALLSGLLGRTQALLREQADPLLAVSRPGRLSS